MLFYIYKNILSGYGNAKGDFSDREKYCSFKDSPSLESMKELITKSNNWRTSPVFKKIQIFGYIDCIPTSIHDNVLKLYFQGKKRELNVTSSELTYWITERFRIDKEIYTKAFKIFNKKS